MKRTTTAALAALLLASASPLTSWLHFAPGAAFAQSSVTFENLSFKSAAGSISIPKITVEGTTATKAEIEALFDPSKTADVGQRAQRISARSVSIPVIEIRQDIGDQSTVTTYRDSVLRDMRNGVVGEWVMPLMTVKGKVAPTRPGAKAVDLDMTAANMVLKELDVGQMLRSFFEKGQPNEPLKVVAKEQTLGRMTMSFGPDIKIGIAGGSIRDFTMRALDRPFVEIAAETNKNEREKAPDWEKRNLALMMPVFSMFGIGTMEMTGLTADMKDPNSGKPVKFSLDRLTAAGKSMIPEKLSIQGFKLNADGAIVNFGEVAFDGLDLTSTFSALSTAMGATSADDLDPAAMIPKLDLFRLSGIDIDVPDTKNAGQRIKAKLGLFETKMGNHVGPIPANIAVNLDRLQMDIPANTKEKGLQDILALGYKAIDFSMRYNQAWEEASKTLRLTDFTVASAGMFSATAKAEIGNVTRDIFTTDKAKAAVAALAVSAKNVEVAVTNNSLFERLIAKQAKDTRRKPEDVRAELAAGATMMAPMLLGDHPAARTIGPILGRFVADPKNLRISVSTRDGAGLGATDFIAAQNPMDLLKKVDIKAAANE